MKLHSVVGSPNCRKVQAVINHLGLEVALQYHDFFQGGLRGADFLGLNPNGMVPVLCDGDLRLWESNAIMQYLAEKAPENALYPRDAARRADITRWQCWELAHFNKALGVLTFEAVAKAAFMKLPPDADAVRWSTRELERHAPVLESHLKGRSFLVGDQLTLADYSMAYLEPLAGAAPFDWSRFPNITAYYERMRAVPHWARTAPPSPESVGRVPMG